MTQASSTCSRSGTLQCSTCASYASRCGCYLFRNSGAIRSLWSLTSSKNWSCKLLSIPTNDRSRRKVSAVGASLNSTTLIARSAWISSRNLRLEEQTRIWVWTRTRDKEGASQERNGTSIGVTASGTTSTSLDSKKKAFTIWRHATTSSISNAYWDGWQEDLNVQSAGRSCLHLIQMIVPTLMKILIDIDTILKHAGMNRSN